VSGLHFAAGSDSWPATRAGRTLTDFLCVSVSLRPNLPVSSDRSAPSSLRTINVPDESNGVRLDQFLVSVLENRSRSQIQRLIKDGHVRVAGREAKANQPVKAGQAVTVDSPSRSIPPRSPRPFLFPSSIRITTSSSSTSRPGWSCIRRRVMRADAGERAAAPRRRSERHRRREAAGHRPPARSRNIGADGGGKHDTAHERSRAVQRSRSRKRVSCAVWGEVMAGRRIDAPIGRDPSNRKKMSARARRAREAVTRILRAEHFGRTLTLARVAIHTGRTHQIRVHLSAIGHPIVGDPLYGGIHRRVPGDLRAVTHLDRPFLHAARLVFTHPVDERRMEFDSVLPDDLQQCWRSCASGSTRRCTKRRPKASRRSSMPIVYTGRVIFSGGRTRRFRDGRGARRRDRASSPVGRPDSVHG